MTYFPKNKMDNSQVVFPNILLPLLYENSKINTNSKEMANALYFVCWYLSNLIIADLIEDKLGYDKDELKVSDELSSDLGADSLDLVEIAIYLEKAAGIPVLEGLEFKRVLDLIDYVFSIMVKRLQQKLFKSSINFYFLKTK